MMRRTEDGEHGPQGQDDPQQPIGEVQPSPQGPREQQQSSQHGGKAGPEYGWVGSKVDQAAYGQYGHEGEQGEQAIGELSADEPEEVRVVEGDQIGSAGQGKAAQRVMAKQQEGDGQDRQQGVCR